MKKNSPLYIIMFMIFISGVFGLGVSFVHNVTLGQLEMNARLYRNRIITSAFKLEVPLSTPTGYEQALEENLDDYEIVKSGRVWHVYISKNEPKRIGFIFRGMGFWDVIEGIMVLSPDLDTIYNVRFLDQKETPGLGARIEEEWFVGQFQGYPIAWDDPVNARITFGGRSPKEGKRIDAITGATQTSMAVERILNSELQAFKELYESENLQKYQQQNGKE